MVDDAFLSRFTLESGFSRLELLEQIKFTGSKFHYSFAPNPEMIGEIINIRLGKGLYRTNESGDRLIYNFAFSPVQFSDGIGTCSLVLLKELTGDEEKNLVNEKRGFHILNVIRGIQPKPTWEMHMIMIRRGKPFISTIFPGTYAPPLPDTAIQVPEEYRFNSKFWNEHALIE
jgi:hypothetical protein